MIATASERNVSSEISTSSVLPVPVYTWRHLMVRFKPSRFSSQQQLNGANSSATVPWIYRLAGYNDLNGLGSTLPIFSKSYDF